MDIKKRRILNDFSQEDSLDNKKNLEKIKQIINDDSEDTVSYNRYYDIDPLVIFKSSPVRTLKDMTEEEIIALEKKYNTKIIRPKKEE